MITRFISEFLPRILTAPPSKIVEPPTIPFPAHRSFSVLSVSSVVNLLSAAFACSPLATSHSPLSLTIPPHPRNSPITPLFPLHTQKQGGGGCLPQNAFSRNSFVFFGCVAYVVNYMIYYIVGAPTFSHRACPSRYTDGTSANSTRRRIGSMRSARTRMRSPSFQMTGAAGLRRLERLRRAPPDSPIATMA